MSFVSAVARILILAAVLLGLQTAKSMSHDNHLYDSYCCGDGDCAPIISTPIVDGKQYYTTKLGTKPVDDRTLILTSKDHRTHACIYQDRLWCLYVAPGN